MKKSEIDEEISSCIAKASSAFGNLKIYNQSWHEHGVSLQTKLNMYCAVVINLELVLT